MRRFHALALTLIAGPCALSGGCSGKASVPGAYYAGQIPLYAAATYADASGGTSLDERGQRVAESRSWFFRTSDPVEKIEAYYRKVLPGARRHVSGDGRTVSYTFVPEGAEEGEGVVVSLRPGEIQITEVLKPGKRKD